MGGIVESSDRSDVNESSFLSGTITVSTTVVEAKVGATRLSTRQYLSIHNTGPGTIYLGTNTVTSSTGRPILRDQSIDLPIGNLGVYLVSGQGNNTVIVQELG
jgi:hypothetical protein